MYAGLPDESNVIAMLLLYQMLFWYTLSFLVES